MSTKKPATYQSRVHNAHSPLTPLPPLENVRRHEVIRFGFSPLTVNRLLEQGTTPTVLKPPKPSPSSAAKSPAYAAKTVAGGGGGAVRKVYEVPKNTPSAPSFVRQMQQQMQQQMQEFDQMHMQLLNVDMGTNMAAATRSLTPPSSRVRPASREDDEAALLEGLWAAIDVRPRLSSSALVQRMLRNNQLGHLCALFKSEEIDLEVILVMSSDDLREIGLEKLDLLRMIRMCSLLRKIYKV